MNGESGRGGSRNDGSLVNWCIRCVGDVGE
jgi:hypothetical protein